MKLDRSALLLGSLLLFAFESATTAEAAIRIRRIDSSGNVILRNYGSTPILEVPGSAGWFWCNIPVYPFYAEALFAPGEERSATASGFGIFPNFTFELGIFTEFGFFDPATVVDYVSVGGNGGRQPAAAAAGLWPSVGFVPLGTGATVYRFIGGENDRGPQFWENSQTGTTARMLFAPFEGYGAIAPGSQGTQALTVINAGSVPLDITNISFSGADASEFSLDPPFAGTVSIPVDSSADFDIVFAPPAVGLYTAQVDFATNSAIGPFEVTLSGVGTNLAQVPFAPLGSLLTLAGAIAALGLLRLRASG